MKRYIYLLIAFILMLGMLLVCYNKLNSQRNSANSIFDKAMSSANTNGQYFILVDAPNWCKDCVALEDLFRANYGKSISSTISEISASRIILKSNNCDNNSAEVNELLSKCEIKNVPSLIIFKEDNFSVITDISEIAATLFNATN